MGRSRETSDHGRWQGEAYAFGRFNMIPHRGLRPQLIQIEHADACRTRNSIPTLSLRDLRNMSSAGEAGNMTRHTYISNSKIRRIERRPQAGSALTGMIVTRKDAALFTHLFTVLLYRVGSCDTSRRQHFDTLGWVSLPLRSLQRSQGPEAACCWCNVHSAFRYLGTHRPCTLIATTSPHSNIRQGRLCKSGRSRSQPSGLRATQPCADAMAFCHTPQPCAALASSQKVDCHSFVRICRCAECDGGIMLARSRQHRGACTYSDENVTYHLIKTKRDCIVGTIVVMLREKQMCSCKWVDGTYLETMSGDVIVVRLTESHHTASAIDERLHP
nr:hypothetical protein CFP56_09552 [Quercus suber]